MSIGVLIAGSIAGDSGCDGDDVSGHCWQGSTSNWQQSHSHEDKASGATTGPGINAPEVAGGGGGGEDGEGGMPNSDQSSFFFDGVVDGFGGGI